MSSLTRNLVGILHTIDYVIHFAVITLASNLCSCNHEAWGCIQKIFQDILTSQLDASVCGSLLFMAPH